MKIVFLDFDGVLVNAKSFRARSGYQATADPLCIEVLNRITTETGAKIVVSSTWRIGTPIVELRTLLKRWGAVADVLDRTPYGIEKHGVFHSVPRGDEIAKWLKHFPRDVESFVILDDDKDMGKLLPFLVQTRFDNGLEPHHADRAIEILGAKVRP